MEGQRNWVRLFCSFLHFMYLNSLDAGQVLFHMRLGD